MTGQTDTATTPVPIRATPTAAAPPHTSAAIAAVDRRGNGDALGDLLSMAERVPPTAETQGISRIDGIV